MKKIIALSCMTAVLLAGCGKPQGDSSSKAENTTAQTTAADTTVEITTEAETSTEPESSASAEDRTTMYLEVYKNKIQETYDMLAGYQSGDIRMSYTLYDFDTDGVPDLVLSYDEQYKEEIIEGILTMYTCDENCEVQEIGYFGPNPAAWGCKSDAGDFSMIFEENDYISILHCILNNGKVGIDDSVELDRDENTVTKEAVTEAGFRYLPYVSIVGNGGDIKSTFTDPNTDKTEEKDGLGFEFFE